MLLLGPPVFCCTWDVPHPYSACFGVWWGAVGPGLRGDDARVCAHHPEPALGGASFFTLKTVSDTAEFFPNHVIVGINQHGVRHSNTSTRIGCVTVELGHAGTALGHKSRRVMLCPE